MRWLKRILLSLLVVVLVVAVGGTWLARRSFPQTNGQLQVAGLQAPVEVVRDGWGIPHIYASSLWDLFFAQGYTHAQDRFWQMDFWRHVGSGRLAEMFGRGQVETDHFLRSLGWADLARQELEALDPHLREILDAYAAGVNAYLEGRARSEVSLEYAILALQNPGYEIEPWEPVHTLTWAKVMSWDLSANMRAEIARTVLAKTIDPTRIDQLYPPFPSDHPVIVGAGDVAAGLEDIPDSAVVALLAAGAGAERVWELTRGGFEGIGSNSWVVDGRLTESGLPLLANDTHLGIQMPSIWYAMGLHCPDCDYRVAGFTFAGTPGVVIGHNGDIAWGVTTQALDTQDLFIERVDPDNPGQYEVDGEWVAFETWPEVIRVAGGEEITVEMRSTRHGPVISGTFLEGDELEGTAALEEPEEYVVSLAWLTLEPSTLFESVYRLNVARNLEEFREALSFWDIAAQNFVYADREGNIAYQSTGKVPIRGRGDGTYPVPGWDSEYGWVGRVDYADLPRATNPEPGYIVSANQPVQTADRPPFLSAHGSYGFRAARIETMLGSAPYDLEAMQQMQMDARDGGAVHLIPHLLAVPAAGNEAVSQIQDLLTDWADGEDPFQVRADSPGAAAYQAVWRHLLLGTFGDELPEEHLPDGGGRWFQAVRLLLDDPADPWWDNVGTAEIESRDDILFMAMADAHAELTDLLGRSPRRWEWGRLHRATFENQTLGQSGIAPIEWLFNRSAPPRVAGSRSLVNATGWTPFHGYVVDWLPAMRVVFDLGDLSSSTFIHTTGQSGHAFHRHYRDMIEPWTDGIQVPMPWDREEVAASTVLELVPAGE